MSFTLNFFYFIAVLKVLRNLDPALDLESARTPSHAQDLDMAVGPAPLVEGIQDPDQDLCLLNEDQDLDHLNGDQDPDPYQQREDPGPDLFHQIEDQDPYHQREDPGLDPYHQIEDPDQDLCLLRDGRDLDHLNGGLDLGPYHQREDPDRGQVLQDAQGNVHIQNHKDQNQRVPEGHHDLDPEQGLPD